MKEVLMGAFAGDMPSIEGLSIFLCCHFLLF